DTTAPTVACQSITVALDSVSGLATITAAQIDNGSTDNCTSVNNLTYSLSQYTFDCTDVGPNPNIILSVTDAAGNTATCQTTVTVTSPNITGGTLIGHLVDGSGTAINTNPDS